MSELHAHIMEMQRIMSEIVASGDEHERYELRKELHETVEAGKNLFTSEQIAIGWALSLEEVTA